MLKATGIVRRVDDLGRIAIPKEIRKRIGIVEGTPLELYLTDKGVLFRMYDNPIENMLEDAIERLSGMYFRDQDYDRVSATVDTLKEVVRVMGLEG